MSEQSVEMGRSLRDEEVQKLYREAKRCDEQVATWQRSARDLRISAYKLGTGFEIGDRVECRGRVFEITKFSCPYDRVEPHGRWVLKGGTLGKETHEISTYSSVRLVAKGDRTASQTTVPISENAETPPEPRRAP